MSFHPALCTNQLNLCLSPSSPHCSRAPAKVEFKMFIRGSDYTCNLFIQRWKASDYMPLKWLIQLLEVPVDWHWLARYKFTNHQEINMDDPVVVLPINRTHYSTPTLGHCVAFPCLWTSCLSIIGKQFLNARNETTETLSCNTIGLGYNCRCRYTAGWIIILLINVKELIALYKGVVETG